MNPPNHRYAMFMPLELWQKRVVVSISRVLPRPVVDPVQIHGVSGTTIPPRVSLVSTIMNMLRGWNMVAMWQCKGYMVSMW